MNKKVQGIVVPMLTPLKEDECLCLESLPALLSHIIAGGVDGIFQISTTSEYTRLSVEERMLLAEETMKHAKGKTTVYLGISDVSTKQVIANAEKMAALAPDFLVCSLPFYYPVKDDREIISFFQEVAKATEIPLVLYNIPVTCGGTISISALKELVMNRKIVGIKDSSGDMEYFAELMALKKIRPDFAVLSGDEAHMPPCAEMGCDGFVPSLGNTFPKLFVEYYQSICAGETRKAEEAYGEIQKMNQLNGYSGSWMSAIAWRKEALSQMGIMPGFMTKPSVPLAEADKNRVSAYIEAYKKRFS